MGGRFQRASRVGKGLAYGVILATQSFLFMGAGHGTYVPSAVSSAPLAVIEYPPPFTFFIGLIGCVVLWPFVAAISYSERWRWTFPTVMILHYAGVAFALIKPIDGNWSYFARMWQASYFFVLLWIIAYGFGQAMLWYWFVEGRSAARTDIFTKG